MKKVSRILCTVLCLVLLACLLPGRAEAAGYIPEVDVFSSGTHLIYGNGSTLYVDEGTTAGKTVVYYVWNGQTRYLNKSGAAGDDLSSSVIWAGASGTLYNGISTSVVVYGGNFGSIYGGSGDRNSYVSSTSIAIHGGTVRNVTCGG